MNQSECKLNTSARRGTAQHGTRIAASLLSPRISCPILKSREAHRSQSAPRRGSAL